MISGRVVLSLYNNPVCDSFAITHYNHQEVVAYIRTHRCCCVRSPWGQMHWLDRWDPLHGHRLVESLVWQTHTQPDHSRPVIHTMGRNDSTYTVKGLSFQRKTECIYIWHHLMYVACHGVHTRLILSQTKQDKFVHARTVSKAKAPGKQLSITGYPQGHKWRRSRTKHTGRQGVGNTYINLSLDVLSIWIHQFLYCGSLHLGSCMAWHTHTQSMTYTSPQTLDEKRLVPFHHHLTLYFSIYLSLQPYIMMRELDTFFAAS